MNCSHITAERLRELLCYDPATGIFTWRNRQGRCLAGSAAGSLDNNGYTVIRLDWGIYKAGRLAWLYTYGALPSSRLRYLDRDPSNNRISNLTDDPANVPKKKKPELTQELIRKLLRYDPETGMFYRNRTGLPVNAELVRGYLRFSVMGKRYQAHRLAWLYMTGAWPVEFLDHKDRRRDNNVWTNLREASRFQNQQNITTRSGTVSGITGISWLKRIERWNVTLMHERKRIFLGHFIHLDDAIKARLAAERKYFTHSPVCEPLA